MQAAARCQSASYKKRLKKEALEKRTALKSEASSAQSTQEELGVGFRRPQIGEQRFNGIAYRLLS